MSDAPSLAQHLRRLFDRRSETFAAAIGSGKGDADEDYSVACADIRVTLDTHSRTILAVLERDEARRPRRLDPGDPATWPPLNAPVRVWYDRRWLAAVLRPAVVGDPLWDWRGYGHGHARLSELTWWVPETPPPYEEGRP